MFEQTARVSGAAWAVILAAVATAGALFVALLIVVVVAGVGNAQGLCAPTGAAGASAAAHAQIPARLIALYRGAAARYALGADGWAWLAAINRIETDFGRNLATSSAGAVGWMQFLPATWSQYGVDANGDGSADPFDPADAIYAAARYLRASGAPADWHRAVLAYNHSQSYYRDVARHAAAYTAAPGPSITAAGGGAAGPPSPGGRAALAVPSYPQRATCAAASLGATAGGYAPPLPASVAFANARTDMGVDLETGAAGVGKPLLAIGDARILHIQAMGAFGPTWISYRLLDGPLAGRAIFIGHSGPPLVGVGDVVRAGQPIIAIHGGSYGGPPGHLEIGWALADGTNTLAASHYAEGQATAEGRGFRRFLARLGMAVCGAPERAQGWC